MARCKAAYDHWLIMLCVLVFASSSRSATNHEGEILLRFKNSLSDTSALDTTWINTTNPCNVTLHWEGVQCDTTGKKVFGLQLQNMGLTGLIDIDTLTELPALQTVSFMNNIFAGPMPDVKRLPLISVYLSQNQFTGDIPDDAFSGMGGTLKKVYLAKNGFTGKIPSSLVALPKLIELDLGDNQFSGKIPNFQPRKWVMLNLANNRFDGPIPPSLSDLPPADFEGNKGLCGRPLGKCKSKKLHLLMIIAIVVISAVAVLLLCALCWIRGRRSRQASQAPSAQQENAQMKPVARKTRGVLEAQLPDPEVEDEYKKAERGGELHFLRKDRKRFEVQELLRAPAEVLGSGSFGSSYKAGILSGSMVVKRFRDMNRVGKDDFYDHMSRLGRLSHPNLLPLVAFYYMKEEKLLVLDFALNGSLASHLHGKRAPGQPGLDWPTRLMIIKGVAKGLGYLYKEFPGMPVPHGHLKSSNVLLDHNFNPVLAEYALIPVINKDHAHKLMVAYKSPEFSQTGRTSKKTDVWSLGILIFEMLTGKFPANYLQQGKRANADLASWVNSVVREEWTGEVFDKEMKGTKNGEGEMLKLLKIGMCCCESSVEGRWDWREAVDKIEELQERDSEEEDYSSYASDGDVYSSRAVTDDDFSFSVAA
ncbi:pollen receptor-like kinase 4 [Argentina anserina]|uniref:pollen receptor-like kinase 4 n=1 Tax=Argentina anserina TaxID=57926 RepID=UPI0021767BF0|nr:pollen receptor-like kinase 4 [Potentilla anserina]